MRVSVRLPIVGLYLGLVLSAFAQSPNGNINGSVADSANAVIAGAEVIAVNDATGVQYTTKTNNEGIFVLSNLPPGPYRVQVSKTGFKTIIKPDIVLNVQDALSLNFALPVGAAYEVLTVEGGAPLVNTENATVSTVVDRQFAENLPMNGRSFQTLIYLVPGVVATPTNSLDSGQFSVNGQRPASNYWMVDGVSGNVGIGAGASPGNGFGGALGGFTALGGTNSLVSVDALQEFRVQTSTFAPEFGRTPGAQISILTRSGTDQFHGTAFDYLRNELLDANNWFADRNELPKPRERQNDFGGTLGGPLLIPSVYDGKDRTFFFFSYEGLRLRLPETTLSNVPDLSARQAAIPAMHSYLNAYPLPNGPADPVTDTAPFDASYSNPSSLDAYSLRLDEKLNHNWSLFARYDYSPSGIVSRGGTGFSALSDLESFKIKTQTATAGSTWGISPVLNNDLRFNYSRTDSQSYASLDNFGGAKPLASLSFPSPYNQGNGSLSFYILSLGVGENLLVGPQVRNTQQQVTFVDSLSWQLGAHALKFGGDWRRLSPSSTPHAYQQIAFLSDVPSAVAGVASGSVWAFDGTQLLFRNLSLYAQDTWRLGGRFSLTYGLRWDLDFAPSSLRGPNIPAITMFSGADFSRLQVAPPGTPPFRTTYGNVAPRVGVAYQISGDPRTQTVLRAGFGLFYDLASSEAGNQIGENPPFGAHNLVAKQTFPWPANQVAPPPIPPTADLSSLFAFNPNFRLPETWQWSVGIERALGISQTLSVSYLGASGRRLSQTSAISSPPSNPALTAYIVDNTGSSNYNALQVQFQRRLSNRVQALASYTLGHSIDNGSAGSIGENSNRGIPGSAENRGPSDFDVRHTLSAAITYDIPSPKRGWLAKTILDGWSNENLLLLRSAAPVDITDLKFFQFNSGYSPNIRPDLVPGQPLYLYGALYPGGRGFNPSAFTDPPQDPTTGNPTRQGTLGRNTLRGFGATQWDFAVHRDFHLTELVKLQFRAEMFNLLNHPNFAPPTGYPGQYFGASGFGISTETLNQSLSGGGLGGGGFSPLYQIGGPRSIQLALKLFY